MSDLSTLIPENLLLELAWGTLLFLYVIAVVVGTKYFYEFLTGRGTPENVAIYYNRKIIHVLAGGVVALLVPKFFTSPTIPLILALVLAVMNYIPHRRGRLMYWFQVEDNMYEVNFCVMWGVAVALVWLILGSPIYALVPIALMAFGDASTGFVRNLIYGRRTKSWWGNLAMFVVSAPITYYILGIYGVPVAAVASIVEHFEFGPIDDNVLVSLVGLVSVILIKSAGLI